MDPLSNILKQRLAAGQTTSGAHPEADVLSAFAERSLKQAERERVLEHLAFCSQCRNAVALSLPNIEEQTPALASPGTFLRFPAAWRWASATAALAVAVGVGTLLYEHEGSKNSEPAKMASVSQHAAAEPNEKDTRAGDQLNSPSAHTAPARRQELAKRSPRREQRSNQVTLAANLPAAPRLDNQPMQPAAESQAEKKKELAQVVTTAQPALPALDGSLNGTMLDQTTSSSRNEIASGKLAQTQPLAAAPAPSAIEYKPAITPPANQSVEVVSVETSAPTIAPAESYAAPLKASGFSALSGATMKRSAVAFNDIVSWTITTAGKLQRQFRGAVKLVEPAPGVIVRAVAARGIEVWAGGSQPDLSAKQWQQAPALFHSSDAGETWTRVEGPWHGQIDRVSLVTPTNVTVVAHDGTWVTHDAGKTWSAP